MAPIQNLVIDQGTTYSLSITVSDAAGNVLDLTNYTVRAQMRRSYGATSSVSFTTSKGNDPTDGELTISLSATQTSNLKPGRYVYDLEIEENTTNEVTRVIEGIITVTPEVTR
jgi:hypothetical protein